MSLPVEMIFSCILIIWFIISLISQFNDKLKSYVSGFDIFGLIPSWSFFAPVPGTSDYRITFRDYTKEKTFTDWQEIEMYQPNKYKAVWNPQKVETKALFDICQLLLNEIADEYYKKHPRMIMTSPLYVSLLAKVFTEPKYNNGVERQFAILSSSGFGEMRNVKVIYISYLHTL